MTTLTQGGFLVKRLGGKGASGVVLRKQLRRSVSGFLGAATA